MPDKGGILEVVLLEEGFDIFGESDVVVCLVVGRIAVVSCINCVDGAGEFARKDTGSSARVRHCITGVTYLLTLWLFLLLPNRP